MNSTMLNLGCGDRFRNGWVNVNFVSTGSGVIAANLNKGIPFDEESFDVVYHSHLLEHFQKTAAEDFLKECYRVLKTNGVVRVVVPDLEAITRNYLLALENAREGIEGWDHNYEWMLLEMYDQVVRNKTGGDMAQYLHSQNMANEKFVTERCGVEVSKIIATGRKNKTNDDSARQEVSTTALKTIGSLFMPRRWKESLLRLLLGKQIEALKIGRFRLGGENHQWMYDSYSLSKLLQATGFKDVTVRSASQSYVSDWASYNLDTEPDGSVYKPDSLFVEAIK